MPRHQLPVSIWSVSVVHYKTNSALFSRPYTQCMKQMLINISFLFLWMACSRQPVDIPEYIESLDNLTVYFSDNIPEATLEVEKLVSFGDTDEVILGRVAGTAVDDQGRVYIGDWDANTVFVFNDEGLILKSMGREGGGPGEFRSIYHMGIQDGMLHVYDFNQQRMNVFSTDKLEFAHTVSLQFEEERDRDMSIWTASAFYLLNNDNYLMQFVPGLLETTDEDRMQHLFVVSDEGRILSDLILELPWGREFITDRDIPNVIMVPYAPKTLLNVSGDVIYNLWSKDLAVKKYDLDGNYINAFYHPVEKSDLGRRDILNRDEFDDPQSQQMIRNLTLPENWPAVRDFVMDDENQFWISLINNEGDENEWWVLQENGELTARFIWPENRKIRHVKNGFIYTLESNEETGFDQVVKYRYYPNM